MLGWKGFFDIQATTGNSAVPGSIQNLPGILRSACILVLHIFLFVTAAIVIFKKKDILS
jgi:ABC-2 type transport system permease protein